MAREHIAFCLDQAYGHINPTFGITRELVRRGYRVSYSVPAAFADTVRGHGAEAFIYEPMESRSILLPLAVQKDGSYDLMNDSVTAMSAAIRGKKTANSLAQLRNIYNHDRPSLIVHDDASDASGRGLADEWRIKRIRHWPAVLDERYLHSFTDDRLVLVSVPRFFSGALDLLDERFQFLGFIPAPRSTKPWTNPWHPHKVVLVSPTTGLLPQTEFCKLAIDTFANSAWRVLLSAIAKFDPTSNLEENVLANLPDNFRLNDSSPHLDILDQARLYVGQAGQRSTLEALYCGVPVLVIPPSQAHEDVAQRIAELGLGVCLRPAEATPSAVRRAAEILVNDEDTLGHVRQAQASMRASDGAALAARLIGQYLAE
jgi:UDP:flavonoid glycosyltransferase YjiC (YdhE family)